MAVQRAPSLQAPAITILIPQCQEEGQTVLGGWGNGSLQMSTKGNMNGFCFFFILSSLLREKSCLFFFYTLVPKPVFVLEVQDVVPE